MYSFDIFFHITEHIIRGSLDICIHPFDRKTLIIYYTFQTCSKPDRMPIATVRNFVTHLLPPLFQTSVHHKILYTITLMTPNILSCKEYVTVLIYKFYCARIIVSHL